MSELSAEIIADLAIPTDLHLSPGGDFVIYTLSPQSKKDEHRTSALWIAPTDGSQPPRQFTSGDAEDRNPQWSPDGHTIALLSDRAKRGTSQIYTIAAAGGEALPLTPKTHKKSVEQFTWSPSGGHIAFLSADEPTKEDERREKARDDADIYGEHWPYARLRLISLATRKVSTLAAGDYHVTGIAWSPAGNEIAYSVRKTPDLESTAQEVAIFRVPVAGGEAQLVCRFPTGINSLIWSSDGQHLLFLASTAQTYHQSSAAVYSVAAQGGEAQRIALGEESCANDLLQPSNATHAIVMAGEGLGTTFYWLESSTGKLIPFFATNQEAPTARFSSWTARTIVDGRTMLALTRSTGNQPWEVYAGYADDQQHVTEVRQLSTHQTVLAGLKFGEQEAFYWTAPDGLKLDGVLVRPPDAPHDQPQPTVVLVHGGPYGRWEQGFNLGWHNWAQWLALAGYAVLMPNPRGGLGHGERFAAAARSDVGGADYADVMAAVDAAIERGIADPERLGIGGWSQGGFMTAWAVTQSTRFKAGIMGAGVSDWGMMVMSSDLPDFEKELGGSAPWDGLGPHRHAQLSPISFAQMVKTPVLILHGQNDARVPLSQATGFHRALRAQKVPTELVVYPREPHSISEYHHQVDVLQRVRSWYDRWLQP
ncbi:MAG TPA: S9 family peptidase [Ktedonobacteraceae bacterium]|nr:S9 family peptidase [Ktedonobacteraceae bacterium]